MCRLPLFRLSLVLPFLFVACEAPGADPAGLDGRDALVATAAAPPRMVHASGDLPTRVQYRRYHVTVNAEGEISVEVEAPFRTECRG